MRDDSLHSTSLSRVAASRTSVGNEDITWSKRPHTRNRLSPSVIPALLQSANISILLPRLESVGVHNGEDLIFLAVELRDRQFRQSLRAALCLELQSYEWKSLLKCLWEFARPAGMEDDPYPHDLS